MVDPSYFLDVSATPVVAEWIDPDGRTRYFSTRLESRIPVTFDLGFNASTDSAFFKLRVPFFTKSNPKEDTSVFVYIPPERVAKMSIELCEAVPEKVKDELGTDVLRLQLHMNEPADFVVPKNEILPKNKVNGDVLYIVNLLARGAIVTLYVAQVSEEQLQPLCNAVSRGGVQSMAKHTDLTGLYFGKGGRVCTDADGLVLGQAPSRASDSGQVGPSGLQKENTPKAAEETLPPYPAPLAPPPSGSDYGTTLKKRRRYSSGAGMEEEHARVLRRLVVETVGGLGQEVRAIKQELEKTKQELRVTQQELHHTREELCETKKELRGVQDELPEVRDSCVQYVDRSIVDAKEELDDRIMEILG